MHGRQHLLSGVTVCLSLEQHLAGGRCSSTSISFPRPGWLEEFLVPDIFSDKAPMLQPSSGMAASTTSPNAYKLAEKLHKAYRDGRPADQAAINEIIDFDASHDLVERVAVAADAPAWLRSASVYSLRGVDGFRFIRCPFSAERQLQLTRAALCKWVEPPSATNLPTAQGVPADDADGTPYSALWARHQRSPDNSLLSRLTWATLGYQYQWTERRYDEKHRSPLPPELGTMSSELAAVCGWQLHPEAAIVNLYSATSTMGGHRDDAEPCQSVPIVSISLGLDAVYLLGGPTKEAPPLAMRLRSGDVIVQGGASRGFVHGVPRVFPGTAPPALAAAAAADAAAAGGGATRGGAADVAEGGAESLEPFARWLSEHRLNLNVRQVFPRSGPRVAAAAAAQPCTAGEAKGVEAVAAAHLPAPPSANATTATATAAAAGGSGGAGEKAAEKKRRRPSEAAGAPRTSDATRARGGTASGRNLLAAPSNVPGNALFFSVPAAAGEQCREQRHGCRRRRAATPPRRHTASRLLLACHVYALCRRSPAHDSERVLLPPQPMPTSSAWIRAKQTLREPKSHRAASSSRKQAEDISCRTSLALGRARSPSRLMLDWQSAGDGDWCTAYTSHLGSAARSVCASRR